MKIAFTHNLKKSNHEDEAEFDTPETVASIHSHLEKLGHQVVLVDVGSDLSDWIQKLQQEKPDLIFNTAEGRRGKLREAFFPAIYEELGIPFTGSGSYSCALTLDKNISKILAQQVGVPVPKSVLLKSEESISGLSIGNLKFPLIIKPNFEGSSKGISQDSIVNHSGEAFEKIRKMIQKYPEGLLIEEYIEGRDITVPFLAGAFTDGSDVLIPAEYKIDENKIEEPRKYKIYDYSLKNKNSEAVQVCVPADLNQEVFTKLRFYAKKCVEVFQLRDFARIDFRVTDQNEVYFIEVNALPSLEVGSALYESAKLVNLDSPEKVLEKILDQSKIRNKISTKANKKIRVGFAYNEKRIKPNHDPNTDLEAEYDAPKTLDAIRSSLNHLGFEVIDLEANENFPKNVIKSKVDFVFNIAEGVHGKNREAHVPAVLEMMNIPFTGSGSAAMAITLDKSLAKKVVREVGIHTPSFFVMESQNDLLPKDLTYPLVVKPVAEGSSKGVLRSSVVENENDLRNIARQVTDRYQQGALVETYLSGREFTVGLLGESEPRVLAIMEIVFDKNLKNPVYSYEHKLDFNKEVTYSAPAELDQNLKNQIENVAKKAFQALGCRDVSRIDLRLDSKGNVHFLECNPLPGLTPGWSDLCMIAQASGMNYQELIAEILKPCILRLEKEKNLEKQSFFTEQRL